MSLASVLVISANSRRFSLKVLASASAAALRFCSAWVLQQVERRLDARATCVPTLKRSAAMVSSNSRFQAE